MKNTSQGQYIDEISFSFKVNVRIFLLATLIATTAVTIYFFIGDKHRKIADFGAAAFGVSLAGASAIHAYRGIIYTQHIAEEDKKTDRTIEYIRKWDDPDIEAKRVVMKRVLVEATGTNKLQYLRKANMEQEIQDIVSVLNFLEKMAFFENEGDLQSKKLKTYYKDIFDSVYTEFFDFIQERRNETKQPNIYEHFEKLHHYWSNGKSS